MTDRIEIMEEPGESANTFLSGLRRILMAGVGAVALTQEQIEDFVGKLVERGEIADGDARKLLADVLDRRKNLLHGGTKKADARKLLSAVLEGRKKVMQNGTRKAEEELEKRVETLLSRMNIPTKGEIDSLSRKITELSRKVDELNDQAGQ